MYDPTQALATWLAAALQTYSFLLWRSVTSLAGGPEGPLWRWVLVEQGLFVVFLGFSSWWLRMVLGLGKVFRTPQHWGTAAVFACGFSLLWSWYGLMSSQAIQLGLHPQYGWEWTFFTWGLPLLIAGAVVPATEFIARLGLALTLGALVLLLWGRLWAGARGLSRRHRALKAATRGMSGP